MLRPMQAVRMPRGSGQVKVIQNYINGKFVGGNREFADVNPADGTVVAQVTEADRDLVDAAVRAARKASPESGDASESENGLRG